MPGFLPETGSASLSKKMLDIFAERQKVLSHNIANIDTPNYKAKDLDFRQALREALEGGDMETLKNIEPEVVENKDPASVKNDGNSVSIDKEMAKIAENASLYSLYAQILSIQYTKMKNAIVGRTR